jgi:hypothetical protein
MSVLGAGAGNVPHPVLKIEFDWRNACDFPKPLAGNETELDNPLTPVRLR